MARGAGASGWGGGSGSGGAKGRREKYSEFGNIDVGGGYKTSQRTLDIAKMEYESNTKQKNVPDWMAKEHYLSAIKNRGGENPQKWVEDFYKENESSIKSNWEKRTKRAKKFPYKTKAEWLESTKPRGQSRKEWEVTTSTYERAVKRKNKQFDKWFGRGMG